jgi:hypothetical protein
MFPKKTNPYLSAITANKTLEDSAKEKFAVQGSFITGSFSGEDTAKNFITNASLFSLEEGFSDAAIMKLLDPLGEDIIRENIAAQVESALKDYYAGRVAEAKKTEETIGIKINPDDFEDVEEAISQNPKHKVGTKIKVPLENGAAETYQITGAYGFRHLTSLGRDPEPSRGIDISNNSKKFYLPFDAKLIKYQNIAGKTDKPSPGSNLTFKLEDNSIVQIMHFSPFGEKEINQFKKWIAEGTKLKTGTYIHNFDKLTGSGTGPHLKITLKRNNKIANPTRILENLIEK